MSDEKINPTLDVWGRAGHDPELLAYIRHLEEQVASDRMSKTIIQLNAAEKVVRAAKRDRYHPDFYFNLSVALEEYEKTLQVLSNLEGRNEK